MKKYWNMKYYKNWSKVRLLVLHKSSNIEDDINIIRSDVFSSMFQALQ